MSEDDDTMGPAHPETVALWVKATATMGPDELADFEARTFTTWSRGSLGEVKRAIEQRLRESARIGSMS